jgi:hypothetical protein
MKRKQEFMTARELARRPNEPYTTVAGWLQRGLVPGADVQKVGPCRVWIVPAGAADTADTWRPKMGRPPLTEEEKAARAKARGKKTGAKKATKKGAK